METLKTKYSTNLVMLLYIELHNGYIKFSNFKISSNIIHPSCFRVRSIHTHLMCEICLM